MPKLSFFDSESNVLEIKEFLSSLPPELLKKHRNLTQKEIAILEQNSNRIENTSWNNIFVSSEEGCFNPELIRSCVFSGVVVIGKLRKAILKYHDLSLNCGLYNSFVKNCVISDDVAVHNVSYLENYRISSKVILFNIQEMSCTNHSKFGNGILKEGEEEQSRIWIGVANENDGRKILPFEKMIPSDAFLWSHFRSDKELLKCFIELTEKDFSKKRDTFGIVEENAVIKNTTLIKDAKIGANAYIKGAFKIKNVTILSSEDEVSQIGEGVELVNGIVGYGCRIFYQAVAVRFVMGRNCQLKYGGRLLNSVLGDNSTVSCCELLNNLIFPFHEQHHNSSFLIATTVLGQSNIAAGATIGSNHNSRSPDGEILAGRGFWPGLCTSFKHNCKFASFVLLAKGDYQNELDIPYPFSLVTTGNNENEAVKIIPGWWLRYNMFAIARNKNKFLKRDKRFCKVQHIETSPLAPDSVQEVLYALNRLTELAKNQGVDLTDSSSDSCVLKDECVQRKFGGIIVKPFTSRLIYRRLALFFAVRSLIEYFTESDFLCEKVSLKNFIQIKKQKADKKWINVGGQIIPESEVRNLFEKIKNNTIKTWDEVHAFYDEQESLYKKNKASYAIFVLETLFEKSIEEFTKEDFDFIKQEALFVAEEMYKRSVTSRQKDFDSYYRKMMYENEAEMEEVLGSVEKNDFLIELKETVKETASKINALFEMPFSE